jgi:predicted metal-dependent hydrolase
VWTDDSWTDESQQLRIQIRESVRSRRLCVRVDRDATVEVVVPRGTPRQYVARFLAEHEEWIARRVATAAAGPPEPFPPAHIALDAIGESWRVHLAGGAGRPRVVQLGTGLLQVHGDAPARAMKLLLRDWVVSRARLMLPALTAEFARAAGHGLAGVQVRTQRTRWGSCSSRGVISLNAAILFQTPAVLRYLFAHEVAHLRHMNHSRSFWAAVAELEPGWRELDRQLLCGWERVPRWFRQRGMENT